MRVVVLTNRQGNQIALVSKIAREAEIAGIVFSRNVARRRPDAKKRLNALLNGVAGRTVGRPFVRTWFELLEKYDSLYPELPPANVVEVENINDKATVETIERLSPELVIVSGTNLLGKDVIRAARLTGGVVNLHTGISPYVRGGPNCTNWCLAKKWFHLIGNTVMWLDEGIDTGNIIATEQTPLDGSETLFDLHWKVMEHAHDIYVSTIRRIGQGEEMPSVPQREIGAGAYFGSSDWTAFQMRKALKNYRLFYKASFSDELRLFPVSNV
jgi:methionyl-tRNA formyltransferase